MFFTFKDWTDVRRNCVMLVCICLNNMQIMLNSSDLIVQLQFCNILIGVIFDGFGFSKFTSQEKHVQQEQLNLTLPMAWIPCLLNYQTDKSNEPYCNGKDDNA